MGCGRSIDRRTLLHGLAGLAAATTTKPRAATASRAPIRFGLTPVFLTSDLALLASLQAYLEQATARPVRLVSRRTYQEITALLVTRQLDAAWICGYPFVAYRQDLSLVAVPVWQGQTRYQSYLIARSNQPGSSLADLRGSVHAFSDPDSNSGYLVTRAMLHDMQSKPETFFQQTFFTYGHRNVIRAVATGMATTGSVDGYVYEVLRDREPELVKPVRVISKSEWLGFPPIACPAGEAFSDVTVDVRTALVNMSSSDAGREVLALLRLDGFRIETPELFDGIAQKMRKVRGETRS
jgi:phosphonate transport system substrate-binding protein